MPHSAVSSRRPGIARALAALALAAAAPLALAHAYPSHRSPDAQATVPTSLATVAIDFDESLEPAFSSLQVANADGHPVTRDKSSVTGAEHKHMQVDLSALKPGVYTVT